MMAYAHVISDKEYSFVIMLSSFVRFIHLILYGLPLHVCICITYVTCAMEAKRVHQSLYNWNYGFTVCREFNSGLLQLQMTLTISPGQYFKLFLFSYFMDCFFPKIFCIDSSYAIICSYSKYIFLLMCIL